MDIEYSKCERADASADNIEGLSYKFQRLREKLRQAVVGGEFAGKLPGERELARRFNANPKTLGKALIDLAAEGLLERRIGRGTYIRDTAPTRAAGRWLILCDSPEDASPGRTALLASFRATHADAEVISAQQRLRPSLLSQFRTVVDVSTRSTADLHRSLLIRGMDIVLVDREPGQISVHAVALDRRYAAWRLAQNLFMAGHRRILVVDRPGGQDLEEGARVAAAAFGGDIEINHTPAGPSAILIDVEAADGLQQLTQAGFQNGSPAIAAIGVCDQPIYSGIYLKSAELEQALSGLLRDAQMHRPVALHLTGTYVERGTMAIGGPRALSA